MQIKENKKKRKKRIVPEAFLHMDHGKKPINSDRNVYGIKGKLPTVMISS